jgi:hypothetical protein
VVRHLPTACCAIGAALQNPGARADSSERLVVARRLHSVVDECAVLAQYNDLVMTQRVRLPRFEVGALQHVVDRGRGDGGEDEVPGEDHDRGVREEREEAGAGAAERGPSLVLERADCGSQSWVGERRGRHRRRGSRVLGSVRNEGSETG